MSQSEGACAGCGKVARQLCSQCKAVFYCSRDCQKSHWKKHKPQCRPTVPYTVQHSTLLGRYLVAARDIKAGEVVLKEKPLLFGPKHKSPPICLGCHSSLDGSKIVQCKGCGFPMCKSSCQDSPLHKAECPVLALGSINIKSPSSTEPHPAYSAITPLRCLLAKTRAPVVWKALTDLQDHVKDIKKNQQLYEFFLTKVRDFLRNSLSYSEPSDDDILKACGVLTTNAFEVAHNGSKIRGLYHTASMLAHDCTANTKHVFEKDQTVVFIATVDIAKGKGICTTYTDTLWNTSSRRQQLQLNKFFSCSCARCSSPTELGSHLSTLLCDACGGHVTCKAPLEKDPVWVCAKCSHLMRDKEVRWGDAVLYRELKDVDRKSTRGLEDFLTKYKPILHPTNRFFVQAKYALIKMYGNPGPCRYRDITEEQLLTKISYCRDLMKLAEILDPGMSLLRGSVLIELQSGLVALAKLQLTNDSITEEEAKIKTIEAGKLLEEASQILRQEPEMRDGGLDDRLCWLAKELDL